LTNREIAKIVGTTEQVVKNYLRTAFDKLGVWSRLELALYVASHGGSRLGRATHFGDGIERLSERFAASSFSRTIAPRGSASQRGALPVVFSVAVLLNGTLSSGPIRNSSTEYSRWGPEGERSGRFDTAATHQAPGNFTNRMQIVAFEDLCLETLWSGIISLTVNYLVLAGGH
jgi:hypothetical protein